ncbi:MAG: CsbD family protein [Casimicrobiaceae bacterium]
MNGDRVQGNWKQFKGKVKEQWGKLTDDQLDVIGGKRDQLAGRVQEVYGVSKDEAERQVSDFERRHADGNPSADDGVPRSPRREP